MAEPERRSLADAAFREELKNFTKRYSPKDGKEWSHKEACLKHAYHHILHKHLQIPSECTDICICSSTKAMVRKEYDKICRVSLYDAVNSTLECWKEKAAKLGVHCAFAIHACI